MRIDYALPKDSMVSAVGRNGSIKQRGIIIHHDAFYTQNQVFVSLYPLTSRGRVGNCRIEIPIESVPAVIVELQKALTDA